MALLDKTKLDAALSPSLIQPTYLLTRFCPGFTQNPLAMCS